MEVIEENFCSINSESSSYNMLVTSVLFSFNTGFLFALY